METVYILEHVYELNGEDEVKHIGIFSSVEKANEVIEKIKNMPGFLNHPIECFQIHKSKLDTYGWGEGFTTVP
jgi:hypothetical protein